MEFMIMPLRRYADFSGRSRRMEFWMFFLFQMIIFALFMVAMLFAGVALGMSGGFDVNSRPDEVFSNAAGGSLIGLLAIWVIWVLAVIIPNAAVVVRRCHDQGISGWVGGLLYGVYFLMFIISPLIAALPGIPLMILMFIDGKAGTNQYGTDPKGRETDVFR